MSPRRSVLQDRRSHSRIDVFLECSFVWDSQAYAAKMIDLSLSGAQIASRVLPPEGTPLQINFTTAGTHRELSLKGTVVRGVGYRDDGPRVSAFGIRFPGISSDLLLLMKEMLAAAEESRRSRRSRVPQGSQAIGLG